MHTSLPINPDDPVTKTMSMRLRVVPTKSVTHRSKMPALSNDIVEFIVREYA